MWDYDSLYEKAKHYVRKGLDHQDPDSTEVPLWCILALELLARATLSRINPAFLVDLKNENSLLSICGQVETKNPTSATINVVLQRCTVLCAKFSEAEKKQCLDWMDWRNQELHTGSSPFAGLRKAEWQPNFFRICSILLEDNETNLKDFLDSRHVHVASKMIQSLSTEKKKEAHNKVKEKRDIFRTLDVQERLEKISVGNDKAKAVPTKIELKDGIFAGSKVVECPTCEGDAVIFGRAVRSNSPRDEEGELVQEDTWFPMMLKCYCCELTLEEYAHISALNLGEPYTTKDVLDPVDYFRIGFEPEEGD